MKYIKKFLISLPKHLYYIFNMYMGGLVIILIYPIVYLFKLNFNIFEFNDKYFPLPPEPKN